MQALADPHQLALAGQPVGDLPVSVGGLVAVVVLAGGVQAAAGALLQPVVDLFHGGADHAHPGHVIHCPVQAQ
ncbi:hypothetical protein [Nonomuraea solani]|uniref:hypothetical protein n=1 Tax=Nonomuraea solani TaxID=1144553 RepID=UPI000CDE788F|nr:hypothetical protein [Nonomuraea solani]